MNIPERVLINEVLLRDGLQLEEKLLTVDEKYVLASALIDAGIASMEFGSCVHPTLVPQMANTGELFEKIRYYQNIDFVAMVPNLKGAERAYQAGVTHINFVFSASDTHNRQNVRQSTVDSLRTFFAIKEFCSHKNIKLSVSIATTFGCPFEGKIPETRVLSLVEQVLAADPEVITLADTTGVANPKQVYRLMKTLVQSYPEIRFRLHFHNTRGMGLANILAGLEAGILEYDASLGGLGGCPFVPEATGNVCTEDVVHMLHSMGIETGIDLDLLLAASSRLQNLIGHKLPSYVLKAGKYDRIYPVPNS